MADISPLKTNNSAPTQNNNITFKIFFKRAHDDGRMEGFMRFYLYEGFNATVTLRFMFVLYGPFLCYVIL